jgi:hypothetical protein
VFAYETGDSNVRMVLLPVSCARVFLARAAPSGASRILTISTRSSTLQQVVEPRGFEPLTSALQRRRSPN